MVHMSRYIFIAKIYNPPFTPCVFPLVSLGEQGPVSTMNCYRCCTETYRDDKSEPIAPTMNGLSQLYPFELAVASCTPLVF